MTPSIEASRRMNYLNFYLAFGKEARHGLKRQKQGLRDYDSWGIKDT
jgi:hypothetical protein